MARARKRHLQQEFEFRTHGGRREGAGRPAKGPRSSEPHKKRPDLKPGSVLLVTLRVVKDVGNLRRPEGYHAIRYALYAVLERPQFRIVHVSIQSSHVHLIAEADSKGALADGLQAFQISAAKHLNASILIDGRQRRGSVFADRYHQRLLGSPRQVRNAISYVLNNWRRHGVDRRHPARKIDPYSSGVVFAEWKELHEREWRVLYPVPRGYIRLSVSLPRTWLLGVGWMKAGEVSAYAVPGPKTKRAIYGP